MKSTRKIVVLLLLICTVGLLLVVSAAFASDSPSHVIKLMYFHRRFRCPSCEVIEGSVAEMLKARFGDELKKGSITWQVINLSNEGNEHYLDKYSFTYNTLIVAEERDGKGTRFKNLQSIYDYAEDIPELKAFVKKEVEAYLK
jgi:hypothetical protein